jgi:hypothetical protein
VILVKKLAPEEAMRAGEGTKGSAIRRVEGSYVTKDQISRSDAVVVLGY